MMARARFGQARLAAGGLLLVAAGTCSGCGPGGGASDSGSGGDGSASEPYTGTVILASIVSGGTTLHTAIVEFLATAAASQPYCQGGTVSGSCCYEPPVTSLGDGGIPTLYAAGDISVTASGAPIGTVSFSSGHYALSSSPSTFSWKPGDLLGVSAAGSTVDRFSASVQAPGLISGLSPALSLTSPIAITLASGWTVAWTKDTASGETMIVTVTPAGGPPRGEISCSVPDSAGTVSVPANLLANFAGASAARVIAVRYAGTSAADANATVAVLAQVEVGGAATLH
jgi:hypothetical protein